MSRYADYALTSGSYDTTRIPIGIEFILDCLSRTDRPLSEQSLLEAGCGTANYLQALRSHVKTVAGIDFSEGMLSQARSKLGQEVQLTCGSILDMPYENEMFDGIICNQVVHHLEEGPGADDDPSTWESSGFPNVLQFFREAFRVLKPDGVFVINVTTHAQLFDGFWWAELIPTAVARVRCRMPDTEPMQGLLTTAGFKTEAMVPDLAGILQGPSYPDPNGPLDESWRAGDSTWSITATGELAAAQQRVRQMAREGTTDAWMTERENKRREIGQTTFFCARKLPN